MTVRIHKLFQYLLDTAETGFDASVSFSNARAPRLGDFLGALDPELSLDWNNRDFRGLPELRAHVLRATGLEGRCRLEDVLITAGAAEANYLAIMQRVAPGDEIVVEAPGWPQAEVLADGIGAVTRRVHRREDEGWRLPLDALAEAVTPRTKLIFLSNPNNPTGQLLTDGEIERAAGIAARVGAWLIIDEVYAGLEWDGVPAPSVAGLYERGITTGSVSKALGLQGLRTGWLICRDPDLVMDAVILRENSSEIMNICGEAIAEIAMRPERRAALIDRAKAEGLAALDRLDGIVRAGDLLTWHRPQAGLIGLARIAGDLDGEAFAARLGGDPWRTFALPGAAYGLPQHVRLGVGGGEDVALDTGMDRLEGLLGELAAGR